MAFFINCYYCGSPITSLSIYIFHLKSNHSELSVYKCSFNGCLREFGLLNSFQKHLNQHLNSVNSSSNTDSLSINTENSSNQNLSLQNRELLTIEDCVTLNDDFPNDMVVDNNTQNLVEVNEMPLNVLKKIIDIIGDEKLTRKQGINMIHHLKEFVDDQLKFMKKIGIQFKHNDLSLINNYLSANFIASEHLIIKELKLRELFIDCEAHIIHTESVEKINPDNSITSTVQEFKSRIVNMKQLFTALFNNKSFLKSILNEYIKLKTSTNSDINNILQSRCWKNFLEKQNCSEDKLFLPIFVYYDDFEPDNPLGSHSGDYKIGGVYIKIATLPIEWQSKLSSHFLAMLFFGDDRKRFENDRIFSPLISQFNDLINNGIKVDMNGIKEICIVPILILGDNLGVNSALGFSESFNAIFFCRFCKMPILQTKASVIEDLNLLRNPTNYEIDCLELDLSSTGIKKRSIWNSLNFFHVTTNYSVDIMHDFLEGICHYDMLLIVNTLITSKIITLDELNYRMANFNFGPFQANRPPPIKQEYLTKTKFKMSASEMNNFVSSFGIMFGDKVGSTNKIWKLYLNLREIMTIIFSREINTEMCDYLQLIIQEHHKLYLEYSHLKPKFHLLTHYPRIMKEIGPVSNINSIRFESFHKFFKDVSKVSYCKKDLLKTLCVKNQFKMAGYILKDFSDKFEVLCGSELKIREDLKTKYNFTCNGKYSSVSYISCKGIKLKPNVVINLESNFENYPDFALIKNILKYKNDYFLCLENITIEHFNKHFFGYEILKSNVFFTIHVENAIWESLKDLYFINSTANNLSIINIK